MAGEITSSGATAMSSDHEAWLNRIETLRTRVLAAVRREGENVQQAQKELFERYGAAAYRYLRRLLHDEQAADEVFGRLWEKVLTGGLKGFDPEKGRFRD